MNPYRNLEAHFGPKTYFLDSESQNAYMSIGDVVVFFLLLRDADEIGQPLQILSGNFDAVSAAKTMDGDSGASRSVLRASISAPLAVGLTSDGTVVRPPT